MMLIYLVCGSALGQPDQWPERNYSNTIRYRSTYYSIMESVMQSWGI